LAFSARFSVDRRLVQFEGKAKSAATDSFITRVGDLAPNFRVVRLDGRPVSLADFRGKRVLIQSWASW
jgi:peroxiredoxin